MRGRRVAVTTTPDRYAAVAAGLESLGLFPVALPCIELLPASARALEEARTEASNAEFMLITSARTIEVLWPDGAMPDVPVAAVGPITARAVIEAGGVVEVVGYGGGLETAGLLTSVVAGHTVFFPHAKGASPETISTLRERGSDVVTAAVYETRSIPPGGDPVDGAMFGSPRAVDGWLLSRDLEGIVVGAVGQTTASALRRRGTAADIVPRRPSFDRLGRLMAEHLHERSWL